MPDSPSHVAKELFLESMRTPNQEKRPFTVEDLKKEKEKKDEIYRMQTKILEEEIKDWSERIAVLTVRHEDTCEEKAKLREALRGQEEVDEETLTEIDKFMTLRHLWEAKLEALHCSNLGLASSPPKTEKILNWASADVGFDEIQDYIGAYSHEELRETYDTDKGQDARKHNKDKLKQYIRDARKYHLHNNTKWLAYWTKLTDEYKQKHRCPTEKDKYFLSSGSDVKILELRVVAIYNLEELPTEEAAEDPTTRKPLRKTKQLVFYGPRHHSCSVVIVYTYTKVVERNNNNTNRCSISPSSPLSCFGAVHSTNYLDCTSNT